MIDEIQPLYLLLASTALLAAAASLSIQGFHKKLRDSKAFWNSPTGLAVQADAGDSELATQLAELRQAIAALAGERAPAPVPFPESKMQNAVLLAKQGASIGDLVQCCGLNAGEARLLLRLHGSRATMDDAA